MHLAGHSPPQHSRSNNGLCDLQRTQHKARIPAVCQEATTNNCAAATEGLNAKEICGAAINCNRSGDTTGFACSIALKRCVNRMSRHERACRLESSYRTPEAEVQSLRNQAPMSPRGRVSGGAPPISACASPLTLNGSYAAGAAAAINNKD